MVEYLTFKLRWRHLLSWGSAVLLLTAMGRAAERPLPVVPAVQQWQTQEGTLALDQTPVILVDNKDQAVLTPTAKLLQEDLAAMGIARATEADAAAPAAGAISLHLGAVEGGPARMAGETYRMVIGKDVQITAASLAGVFYGTRTLLQLLQANRSRALPCGTITDYPEYTNRMLMIDVARKPFPLWVLKDYLRLMAWYKMNELHLHLSDDAHGYSAFRVQSKKFPGLAAKDLSYSWADLRDLQDFAKARGITITPEIDMPGHAHSLISYWPALAHPKLGNTALDITNPKTAETMKELLGEMIPLFDAPDFHIGTDEYWMGSLSKEEKEKTGEAFRQFINTMNAFVRSKGKNCRIWSGFESMPGTTLPDPSVVIDMWVTHDAKTLIERGHKVISSSDGYTYLVPCAPYYGVSNSYIYQSWEPFKISGDASKNPAKDDVHLLGGKLHIWNDPGPSGYTLTEIAALAVPSLQAFGEKLWGHKGSDSYAEFQKRAAGTGPVPGVTMLARTGPVGGAAGLVFHLDGEQMLADAKASVPLPWANNPEPILGEYAQPTPTPNRADLEYPWTLSMQIKRTADLATRGVILSSDLVEICANYTKESQVKEKGPDGKELKKTIRQTGIGTLRAAGCPLKDPHDSVYMHYDTDRVVADTPALNQWVNLTIVGLAKQTQYYVDGQLVSTANRQLVCPLKRLGSATGNSFVGVVKDLKVWNYARTAKEIGRAAGLDIPDNLAAGKPVQASVSDTAHGFTPDKITDEDTSTRWSSGPITAPQWVTIDLGQSVEFNTVHIAWETARPTKLRLEVTDDPAANNWKEVYAGPVSGEQTKAAFPNTRARHLRVRMSDAANGWGYSIWELEITCAKKGPGQ